jgi:hypothetical protein
MFVSSGHTAFWILTGFLKAGWGFVTKYFIGVQEYMTENWTHSEDFKKLGINIKYVHMPDLSDVKMSHLFSPFVTLGVSSSPATAK